jgi:hypothetical protein
MMVAVTRLSAAFSQMPRQISAKLFQRPSASSSRQPARPGDSGMHGRPAMSPGAGGFQLEGELKQGALVAGRAANCTPMGSPAGAVAVGSVQCSGTLTAGAPATLWRLV